MMIKIKPWRFVAALMFGFALGCGAGSWFYAKVLDKPETVMKIGKQKIKGHNNRGTWTNEQSQPETDKGRTVLGKSKNMEEK
jgi:hypothetical protein